MISAVINGLHFVDISVLWCSSLL